MATQPGVSVTKVAGQLTLPGPLPSKALVIGPSSAGTKNTVLTFAQTADVLSTAGYGPGATAAQIMLADNPGSVDFIRANASIAGFTANLVTSSVASITLAGTPLDSYQGVVAVTTAGTLDSAARFQFSLDGQNFSANYPLVGSFTLPNTGLTLTFATGSYSVGTVATFNAFAPSMNAGDLTSALNAFTGTLTSPTVILVANDSQSAVSGSALFASVDSALTTYTVLDLFAAVMMPTGGADSDTANTNTAWSSSAASTGNIIEVIAERARRTVPLPTPGYVNPKLPFVYAVASRTNGDLVSTNPARYASGPLTAWSSPTYDDFINGAVYLPQSLGAPRTFRGSGGVYLNQALNKVAPGSAYLYWQWGRVINLVAVVVNAALQPFINASVRVLADGTGQIDPRDAKFINGKVNSLLQAQVMQPLNAEGTPGYASAVAFSVNQSFDVLTSSKIQGTCLVVPQANVSNVAVTLGFTTDVNPSA